MKFNCGKTKQEKSVEAYYRVASLQKWHKKFAWLPIQVGPRDCRWLEYVEIKYPEARRHWDDGIELGSYVARALQAGPKPE